MNLQDLLIYILSVYAVTLVITKSMVFLGLRFKVREFLAFLPMKFLVMRTESGDPMLIDIEDFEEEFPNEKLTGYDFISCRMCVGFWVTMAFCLFTCPVHYWLAVYGASYFLATQERD